MTILFKVQRGAPEALFRHRHLLGIEGLSPVDINHVLDLADGYVELRQAEKKVNTSLTLRVAQRFEAVTSAAIPPMT